MEGQNISSLDQDSTPRSVVKDFRVFVATWNVGGKSPDYALDLEDFLHVDGPADIYVLGFQEIVPLSAGNVLVLEDNEPAARWIALISHALNKATRPNPGSNHTTHDLKPKLFHKPSMKNLSRNIKADGGLLKACNCETITSSSASNKMRSGSVSFRSTIDDLLSVTPMPYCLVASKQMVGLFLSVWARKELVQHIGHLGISCVGRGIMGYLGNKGCISISFTLHRTSFCFVCSHLASGEKEGDEVRRNSDVAEILKNSHFPRNCKNPGRYSPERIIDHDRILWLGDLNYRMALSYEETRTLLENNDWDALLEKDQLNMEREAGRVFSGWSEGKIGFAPTYKYSHNSDSYAGETVKSKKKRRTPAWCDRILWRGNGIEQLLYIRGESRFSDHRPVCAVFAIETEMKNKCMRLRKGFSYATGSILECEDCMPKRHSFGFI
ncbi:type I inositol polyphosphate 5-phosphatase 5 [Cynara cardunculus var. scolymus]|uniref:type I inositol polyphosphate 5-phosphatase 5 n=1 Tax=Cynara cardunculus var. scolymus TaxID=59895 RepID=UPI000D6231AE|nr:type I inositol polyphosphate 5-phosphatase 5 [Cynara cardunculus var. scolymus]